MNADIVLYAEHEELGEGHLVVHDLDAFIHASPTADVAVYFPREGGDEDCVVVPKRELSKFRFLDE